MLINYRFHFTKDSWFRTKCIILLLLSFASVVNAQNPNQKITLSVMNVTIKEFIKQVELKTTYTVVYRDILLDEKKNISVSVVNKPLVEVLKMVLSSKALQAVFNNNTIIITKKNVEPQISNIKKVVTGIVLDEKGLPVIGASIMIPGSSIGVATDLHGRFSIEAPIDAKLRITYIGYEPKEELLKAGAEIKISLEQTLKSLNEVVVVAYGTQKKVSVTGSVSSIVTKDIKQSPSPNLVGSLTGRLPGLITVQDGGQPGMEGFNIYLRGASTTNGQNPLILIDGVPRDNISTIDPNEIASVSILKDASSTAVFGVRGANGVILITTKRGTTETPQLNITVEQGLQDFTRQPQHIDSWDFARVRNEALENDGLPLQFSKDAIDKYKSGVDPFLYPNTDWYKLMVKKFTPLSRYNLNVSGGTNRVKYFINAGYTSQGGMFNTETKSQLGYDPQYKMDRYNFRTNLDINMNSWIKSSVNLAGYVENMNESGALIGGETYKIVVRGLYQMLPITPGPLTIAGYGVPAGEVITTSSNNINPSYGVLNRLGFRNTDRSNLSTSISLDFDLGMITTGLSSKFMASFDSKSSALTNGSRGLGYTRYFFDLKQVYDPVTELNKDQATFTPSWNPQLYPLTLSKSGSFAYTMNLQWSVNYARTFKKHLITGMFLAQRDNSEALGGSSDQLLPYNVLGVSGRATYSYDYRYLIEFNAGYNGSEQFQRDQRFGFFPAISAGWVISNEKFMKSQQIISNLKLRASYGKVGNDKIGSERFLYMDNLSVVNGGFSGSLGQGKYINENLLGNPLITWETAFKQNYGIEMTLFKDLSITGDLFFEDRQDILLSSGTIPALQGVPLSVVPKINVGRVDNRGYEIEMVYNKRINKDLSFVVRGNYNYNKNTVKNVDEPPYDASYPYKYRMTGYSLGQNWGYLIDWNSAGKGYFASQTEINNSGLTFAGIQPKAGDFVYKDVNGDKIIDDKDMAPIKYGYIPRVTYGINLSTTYKGIDLSVLLQGVAQTSQYYTNYGIEEWGEGNGSYVDYHLSAWSAQRFESGQAITYPRLTTTNSSSSHVPNDFFIMDRSYIRLKNVEIGYTLPHQLSKLIGTQKIRFYANGMNIFVWDKLRTKSFDPEQGSNLSIPIVRVFNFGANIIF